MIEDGGYLKKKYKPGNVFPLKKGIKDKALFALAHIGSGSAGDVAGKLADLEETENVAALEAKVESALSALCKEGHVSCDLDEQVMIYRLV